MLLKSTMLQKLLNSLRYIKINMAQIDIIKKLYPSGYKLDLTLSILNWSDDKKDMDYLTNKNPVNVVLEIFIIISFFLIRTNDILF